MICLSKAIRSSRDIAASLESKPGCESKVVSGDACAVDDVRCGERLTGLGFEHRQDDGSQAPRASPQAWHHYSPRARLPHPRRAAHAGDRLGGEAPQARRQPRAPREHCAARRLAMPYPGSGRTLSLDVDLALGPHTSSAGVAPEAANPRAVRLGASTATGALYSVAIAPPRRAQTRSRTGAARRWRRERCRR